MDEHKRSSEEIRRDIATEEEKLSQTVAQIGERINEKLDWRTQVKDAPYWSLGAAAGLGYFASKLFIRRATPMERILASLATDIRGALGGASSTTAGAGLIKMTLLGIATKAAADWMRDEYRGDSGSGDGAGSQPRSGRDADSDPETTQ